MGEGAFIRPAYANLALPYDLALNHAPSVPRLMCLVAFIADQADEALLTP